MAGTRRVIDVATEGGRAGEGRVYPAGKRQLIGRAAALAAGIKKGRHDGTMDGVVGLAQCDGAGQRVGLSSHGAAPDGWRAPRTRHHSSLSSPISDHRPLQLAGLPAGQGRVRTACVPVSGHRSPPRGAAAPSRVAVTASDASAAALLSSLRLSEDPPVRDIDRRQFVHYPAPSPT